MTKINALALPKYVITDFLSRDLTDPSSWSISLGRLWQEKPTASLQAAIDTMEHDGRFWSRIACQIGFAIKPAAGTAVHEALKRRIEALWQSLKNAENDPAAKKILAAEKSLQNVQRARLWHEMKGYDGLKDYETALALLPEAQMTSQNKLHFLLLLKGISAVPQKERFLQTIALLPFSERAKLIELTALLSRHTDNSVDYTDLLLEIAKIPEKQRKEVVTLALSFFHEREAGLTIGQVLQNIEKFPQGQRGAIIADAELLFNEHDTAVDRIAKAAIVAGLPPSERREIVGLVATAPKGCAKPRDICQRLCLIKEIPRGERAAVVAGAALLLSSCPASHENSKSDTYDVLIGTMGKIEQETRTTFLKLLDPADKKMDLILAALAFLGQRPTATERSESAILSRLVEALGSECCLILKREAVIDFLQSEKGKELLESSQSNFLDDPALLKLLEAAYPPEIPENLYLYPVTAERDPFGSLLLTLHHATPLRHPDSVWQALGAPLEKGIDDLIVYHYGSPAIDEGGLGRQFLAQLLQGLLTRSERMKFQNLTDGTVRPAARVMGRPSAQEIHDFALLGKLLGFAAHMHYPVGEVFNAGLFHTLQFFSAAQLSQKQLDIAEFYSAVSDHALIRLMESVEDLHDPNVAKAFQGIKNLYRGTAALSTKALPLRTEEELRKIGQELLNLWGTESDPARSIEEIYCRVKEEWLGNYHDYFVLAHAMARGIRKALPFSINGIRLETWEDLQAVSAGALFLTMQGTLTREDFKEKLLYESVYEMAQGISAEQRNQDQEKLQAIQGWLHAWVDRQPGLEPLRNLVQTFTGGRSLTAPITFNLTPHVQGIYPHTCGNYVDIPRDIDKDSFAVALDAFGRGELLEFTAG